MDSKVGQAPPLTLSDILNRGYIIMTASFLSITWRNENSYILLTYI